MQDRLKYRAWLKSLNKHRLMSCIDFLLDEIECIEIIEGKYRAVRFSFDDVVLEQSTGLLAAKSYRGESEADRLVYQGDLLSYKKVVYTNCSREEIEEILPEAIIEIITHHEMASIVKVHKGNVRAMSHDVLEHQALILELDGDELEIIGAVHENNDRTEGEE